MEHKEEDYVFECYPYDIRNWGRSNKQLITK